MNKIVLTYSIINCLTSGIVRLVIMIMALYIWSQHYQGYLLTVVGIMGCLWAFESYFYEYRLSKIEERLFAKDEKEVKQ